MWTSSLTDAFLASQGTVILVGVVSSIIATLLISISGRYSESCRAHTNIVHWATEMSRWVRSQKNYFCSNSKETAKHGYYLNQYYMNMCSEACRLTYGGDFSKFSSAVTHFIHNLNEDMTAEDFDLCVEDFDTAAGMYNGGCIEQNS